MPDGDQRARVRVAVVDAHGRPIGAAGLARWLARVAPARTRGAVSIALVSDARVRALNRRYRGKDYATDVLSFPAAGDLSSVSFVSSVLRGFLGDIVIARGVMRRQARAARHSELTELRVLALHGLLHLLGYDHERDGGRMGRLERRLRVRGGLREGLIERGPDDQSISEPRATKLGPASSGRAAVGRLRAAATRGARTRR